MCLGTIVYDKKIYNLDYMTAEEIKDLLNSVQKRDNKLLINKDIIELDAILEFVYTNKVSEETVAMKISNQINSIHITIDRINPKFRDNSKNSSKIEEEIESILEEYELVLKQYSQKYDKKIQNLIFEKIDVEIELLKQNPEENDDKESIKNLEKQIKLLNRKINNLNERKKLKLWESMEVGGKNLSTEIRKPKSFTKITKFFVNRFNTYNVIKKNVIEPLNLRINEFKQNELKNINKKIEEFDFKSIQTKILAEISK